MIYLQKKSARLTIPVRDGRVLVRCAFFSLWLQSPLYKKIFILKIRPSDLLEHITNDIFNVYVFLPEDIKNGEYEYFLTDYEPDNWKGSAVQKNDLMIFDGIGCKKFFGAVKVYASGLAKIERYE